MDESRIIGYHLGSNFNYLFYYMKRNRNFYQRAFLWFCFGGVVLFLGVCIATQSDEKIEAIKRQKIENCKLCHVELTSFDNQCGIFTVKKSFGREYVEISRYCLSLLPKFKGDETQKIALKKISLADGSVVGFDNCGNAMLL